MIKQDYKPQRKNRLSKLPKLPKHYGYFSYAAIAILALVSMFSESASYVMTHDEIQLLEQSGIRLDLALDLTAIESQLIENETVTSIEQWQSLKIKSGDSLARLGKKLGLSAKEIHQITQIPAAKKVLTNIQVGKTIEYQTENNQLSMLRYPTAKWQKFILKREGEQFKTDTLEINIDRQVEFRTGVIHSNLFAAGQQAGLSEKMLMELADTFGYDIDFSLDIRKGDSFSVLYETLYLDGKKVGEGKILSAEFINQGDSYQAVYYEDKDIAGYFTPEGRSMRKAFLRSPVHFKYISDGFNPRRYHPVQKRYKPHRGIDYAANVGTPVRASGDGKVIASSYNKYNGKYVFIQHGGKYQTKYLHLSRRAVSNGKKIKQGDIIGYVGSTGMVTGPHLHYEFLVNGVHRNPRTVKFPDSKPIAKSKLAQFKLATTDYLAQMNTWQRYASAGSMVAP